MEYKKLHSCKKLCKKQKAASDEFSTGYIFI